MATIQARIKTKIRAQVTRLANGLAFIDTSRILCIGHSHLHCVEAASATMQLGVQTINFWHNPGAVLGLPENPTLTPALQQRFRDHRGTVFSFIGGAAHTLIGLVSPPRRFDFVLPEAPELPLNPQAEVLPVDAVQEVLMELARPFLKIAQHVRSLTRGRMYQLEPPAPYGDDQQLYSLIPWQEFPGMLHEVVPRLVRYKVWRLHSKMVAEFCTENDIIFIGCPPESVDSEGFLRSHFLLDGIHANGRYGKLLLRQMGKVV